MDESNRQFPLHVVRISDWTMHRMNGLHETVVLSGCKHVSALQY